MVSFARAGFYLLGSHRHLCRLSLYHSCLSAGLSGVLSTPTLPCMANATEQAKVAGAYLRGSFPHLRMLILKSQVIDNQDTLPCDGEFLAPKLSTLELDGKSFAGGERIWMEEPTNEISERKITLTHYAPTDMGMSSELTMDSVYASLNRCAHLTLFAVEENVEFNSVESEDSISTNIGRVCLQGLRGTTLSRFFNGYPGVDTANITHCDFEGGWEAPLGASSLNLYDIEGEKGLIQVLKSWKGSFLNVQHCPGFNKRVLETMIEHPPENMDALVLYTDDNLFSVELFRNAVSAWEEQLLCLAVYQPGDGPSEQDIAWFEERLEAFKWATDVYIPRRNRLHSSPPDYTDATDLYGSSHVDYSDNIVM
ncbi:hypothetical protein CONPUDRAFT_165323 [Coniophora puteana RWD-64-598 SS2]|uniref:Uncharacterized protein n=1 Tax=Coniophora puteana (strain RWD-64-598) TaxID=741705 RepID=A0A5M3MPI6_CONPW|nr:uncharacterized protein CONPUDRAFT_165323 [Coniophora puteana RWD-64-598 SS2]EIW81102.1 hypothetical protein CONPUDRAFT_165323 [Coniophora puteana RWD-64-598 SS2]